MPSSKSYFYWISILIITSISCTEQFHPEIDSDLSILVVDGKITNEMGPYEVRLFRTVDLISVDTLKPETGAIIILNDDLGNSELLEEISPGIYQNLQQEIKGTIDQSYWISIETNGGDKFESEPEKMSSPYDILDIYGKEVEKITSSLEKKKVVTFYFDAKTENNDANYLRWEYRESYEWRSPEYLNTEQFTENPSTICFPVTDFPLINIYNASELEAKIISTQPTSTIYTNEVKLLYNYLIDMTLFSTTKKNYRFWETIKSINYSEGNLYNVLTANIDGNIIACDENCEAIGYFEVSSVSKKQKFFNESNFTLEFANYPEECETFEMRMEDDSPDPARFHVISSYPEGRATVYVVRRNECYECNIAHPVNKPSFWPK